MADAFKWIMFLCTAFVLFFNLFYMYPKRWQDRKIILGVKSRKEFTKEGVTERINAVVEKVHKQAVAITVIGFVIAVLLLFVRGMMLQTFFWMLFLFIAVIADMIPYVIGHSALMSIKKEIGIQGSDATLFRSGSVCCEPRDHILSEAALLCLFLCIHRVTNRAALQKDDGMMTVCPCRGSTETVNILCADFF